MAASALRLGLTLSGLLLALSAPASSSALGLRRGRLAAISGRSPTMATLPMARSIRGRCVQARAQPPLSPTLRKAIDQLIQSNTIVLFMKGTKDFPQCGFSNTCVSILSRLGVDFETVNVLENEMIRQGMKVYSDWPTFPQVYIGGEFYGGCDIMLQGYETGDLVDAIEKTMA
mmetsp:Transcript_38033/g.73132  ORF Transcript_38033/g.73132 Transcript_38033/m.73132 type:complete len:173 (-) Transcript_38033:279-797(-)